jgi:hypothetical protein
MVLSITTLLKFLACRPFFPLEDNRSRRRWIKSQSVTLSVTASGAGSLSYQWQKDGVDIPGATTSSFSLSSAQPWHIGEYRVKVTDSVGTVTSEVAELSLSGEDSGIWKSLISYYTFDNDLITEVSGMGQNLNAVQVTRIANRFGIPNTSAAFSAGQSSRLTTASFFPVSGKGAKTVSAWIRYSGSRPQDYREGTIVRWGGTAPSEAFLNFELRVMTVYKAQL